jgi:hypothetical protein
VSLPGARTPPGLLEWPGTMEGKQMHGPLTVDALIDRYGAEKIARTQAVFEDLGPENLARVRAGWKARLAESPDDELLQAIVFLLEDDE